MCPHFLELLWTTSGFVSWCVVSAQWHHCMCYWQCHPSSLNCTRQPQRVSKVPFMVFSHPWWTALITATPSSPPWPLSSSREAHRSYRNLASSTTHRGENALAFLSTLYNRILTPCSSISSCPENEGCFRGTSSHKALNHATPSSDVP